MRYERDIIDFTKLNVNTMETKCTALSLLPNKILAPYKYVYTPSPDVGRVGLSGDNFIAAGIPMGLVNQNDLKEYRGKPYIIVYGGRVYDLQNAKDLKDLNHVGNSSRFKSKYRGKNRAVSFEIYRLEAL